MKHSAFMPKNSQKKSYICTASSIDARGKPVNMVCKEVEEPSFVQNKVQSSKGFRPNDRQIVKGNSTALFTSTTPGTYTGIIVPAGVTSLNFLITGGTGGTGNTAATGGGQGQKISGTIPVNPGDNLTVTVGANGGAADSLGTGGSGSGKGGIGGGGGGGQGGGGGGSEILNNTTPSTIVVAGGGGGASIFSVGGNAGLTAGATGGGTSPGTGGTQTSAGTINGSGMNGGSASTLGGGGGGGGHFGGGAGGPSGPSAGNGGGGASSFIPAVATALSSSLDTTATPQVILSYTPTLPPQTQLFSSSTPGTYSTTVPCGVTSLNYTIVGGTGGQSGNAASGFGIVPGKGAAITGSFAVSSGDSLTLTVGANGQSPFFSPSGGLGAGNGGNGSLSGASGGGGGGGGSEIFDVTSNTFVIAGAGGGRADNGSGGNAGQTASGSGGAGTQTGMNGGSGSSGGAGGGGGYLGGGGGNSTASGGGGGSSYTSAPGTTVTSSSFDTTSTPQVILTYNTPPQTQLFSSTTPGPYTITVPPCVTSLNYTIVGGSGATSGQGGTPGQGEIITGTFAVNPQDTLNLTVGANGNISVGGAGAGNGGNSASTGGANYSGGGGGASEILDVTSSNFIVAGAGGGAGYTSAGGNAGLTTGQTGPGGNGGTGGTQSSAGTAGGAGAANGSVGNGGSSGGIHDGGGGGGYYGGGGGGTSSGGGGGSSWTSSPGTTVSSSGLDSTATPQIVLTYSTCQACLNTVPGAPTGVTATAGNQQATVSWMAPSSNGGAAITSYNIYVYNATTSALVEELTGVTSNPATITGLTNGTSYDFQVSAVNSVGEGPQSAPSNQVTPTSVPSAPTGVTSSEGTSNNIIVSWTAPASNGGSPLTSYDIYVYNASTSSLVEVITGLSPSSTTRSITGLTQGTSYYFQVSAVNVNGEGPKSTPSNVTTLLADPTAPTGVTATAGNQQATVTWTAPSSNGGSAITSYTVYVYNATTSALVATVTGVPGSPATITGLTNGTSYDFTVAAVNSYGTGPQSNPSNVVTPSSPNTVPGAPTNVVAAAGNQQATVSWTAPASNGGSPITSYTIYVYEGTTLEGSITGVTSSPTTITGLVNGTSYDFTVSATNAIGEGPQSSPSNVVVPSSVPDAPTNVTATAGNSQAIVSWTPSNNEGSTVTSYNIYVYNANTSGLVEELTGVTSNPATVTGLTNGVSYDFQVSGVNADGEGPQSLPSNVVTPSSVPDAPTNVTATAGNQQATVSWTAPYSEGSAITSYNIYVYDVTNATNPVLVSEITGVTSNPTTITGLTNGKSYDFQVSAVNADGEGPKSSPSNVVTPSATPNTPTNVTATAGNQQATVSFSPPTNTGGLPITSYTVYVYSGNTLVKTVTGVTGSPVTITGLTNGTSYDFEVAAVNADGTGSPSSPSNVVVPSSVPDAPTNVTATAGNGQATVSWTAPNNEGSLITSYNIYVYSGSTFITKVTGVTSNPAIVTGLTNGTSYDFEVSAVNADGEGPKSAPSNVVVPSSTPNTPSNVVATAGNGQATVSFSPPTNTGGLPITSYTVYVYSGNTLVKTITGVSGSPVTITGLTNGTSYDFEVAAVNADGTGAPSSPSNVVVPSGLPGAPTNVVATAGNGQATVTWTAPNNGGSPITSYTVYIYSGNTLVKTVTGVTTTSYTATGLTNGTSYDFVISATNANGTGPKSAPSNVVTLGATPSPPTTVVAVPANASALVLWTPSPNNGGSPITSYQIKCTSSNGGATGTASNTYDVPTFVNGLTNGKTYTCAVDAVNKNGAGPYSTPSKPFIPATNTPLALIIALISYVNGLGNYSYFLFDLGIVEATIVSGNYQLACNELWAINIKINQTASLAKYKANITSQINTLKSALGCNKSNSPPSPPEFVSSRDCYDNRGPQ
jgi:hypothetical protein